jgi:hypothetical protein
VTYLLIGLWLFCGYTAMRWTLQKTEPIKSFGDAVLACLAICYGPILWPVTLWARWQAQQTWRRLREPKPEPKPLKWINRLFGIKALLIAALLMGGCDPAYQPPPPAVNRQQLSGRVLLEVVKHNGRDLECAILHVDPRAGGLSCNWDAYNAGSK